MNESVEVNESLEKEFSLVASFNSLKKIRNHIESASVLTNRDMENASTLQQAKINARYISDHHAWALQELNTILSKLEAK